MTWLSDNYIYRKLLTVSTPEDLPAGHPIEFSLSASVEAQGKVRDDYEDIEVVRDSDNTAVNRTVALQPDGSLKIVFVPLDPISDGDESYLVYYGDLELLTGPARDATAIAAYPVVYAHNSGDISFQRPGEDWKDGVSTVSRSKASFTGYCDDVLITFVSGPDKGIAEVQLLSEEDWTEVDTFATTAGTTTYAIAGDNSFDLKHLRIRVSGRSNLSSSGVEINLSSISVSKPQICTPQGEQVNLDAL